MLEQNSFLAGVEFFSGYIRLEKGKDYSTRYLSSSTPLYDVIIKDLILKQQLIAQAEPTVGASSEYERNKCLKWNMIHSYGEPV